MTSRRCLTHCDSLISRWFISCNMCAWSESPALLCTHRCSTVAEAVGILRDCQSAARQDIWMANWKGNVSGVSICRYPCM
jgi:hypothetical protein